MVHARARRSVAVEARGSTVPLYVRTMHARTSLRLSVLAAAPIKHVARSALRGLHVGLLGGALLPVALSPAFAQNPPKAPAPASAAPAVQVDQPAPPAAATSSETFDLEAALVTQERGLTSDEAGQRARARAPQIASAQAGAESARWDAEAQSSSFYPTLNVSAQYKRIKRIENNPFQGTVLPPGLDFGDDAFTQPVNNYNLLGSFRWPVSELFLRVYPSYKAARNVAEARQIEVEARAATVELTAREAFYAHARALAAQLVADQALKQAEAQAAQAKLFVDAGTAAPVDLMTATARVESMRAALARTRGQVAVSRNTLATYMGVPTADISAIQERVTALPEPPQDSVDQLLKRGLEQRPELRALRKTIGANDQLKIAERNAALPVLSVEGNGLYAKPNPRYIPVNPHFKPSWEVGATVAWSPNSALVGSQRNKRASAEIERARSDLMALEDGVRIEVVQSFEDYKAAAEAARASEEQQKAAEETYRVRLATYRVGAGVQIDLLTADLALTQARLDHVNAVLDARISLARLARATGGGLR
jgi:outer membrane protein